MLAEEGTTEHHPHKVQVTVNTKPVEVRGPRATGLEIKEDAIAQGVQIELDFILSVELPDGRHRVVGNDQTITVHKGQAFTAVPDDDNS